MSKTLLINRRSVVRGAAWAAPVVAVAAAAPAMATSPSFEVHAKVNYDFGNKTSCYANPGTTTPIQYQITGSSSFGGMFFPNATSSDTLEAVTFSIFLPFNNLTFTSSNAGWGPLQVVAGSTMAINGQTHYEYLATAISGGPAAVSGTYSGKVGMNIPFLWTSNCVATSIPSGTTSLPAAYTGFFVTGSAKLNGTSTSDTAGPGAVAPNP